MSDDNKNIFDEIEEIIFSDEFEQEIEKSLSENNDADVFIELEAGSDEQLPDEKTIVKGSHSDEVQGHQEPIFSAADTVPMPDSEKVASFDLDETQHALEVDFSDTISPATDIEMGEHDVDAFSAADSAFDLDLVDIAPQGQALGETQDVNIDMGGLDFESEMASIDLIEDPPSQAPTEDASQAMVDTSPDIKENEVTKANIQDLFMDIDHEPVRASTELETVGDSIEDVTEFVESEDLSGDVSNSISAEVDLNSQMPAPLPDPSLNHAADQNKSAGDDLHAPSKSSQEQWPEKKSQGLGAIAKVALMLGLPLILAGLALMVLFTEEGLFGLSLKREATATGNTQSSSDAPPKVKITEEVLAGLDQQYDQAMRLFEDDAYVSYQKAKGIIQDILDTFPNYEYGPSAYADSVLLAQNGMLDPQQLKDVQNKLKQSDQISPNTAETLRAKIRFLLSQSQLDKAKARVDQLVKVADQKNMWQTHLIAAEFALETKNLGEADRYLDLALRDKKNLTRAAYLRASLEVLKDNSQEAIAGYQKLVDDVDHMPSFMAILENQYHNNQDVQTPLETMLTEKSKGMSPYTYAKGYRMLSDIFEAKGKKAKSIQMLKLAVKKMALSATDTHALGLKLEGVAKHGEALGFFKQAHLLKPNVPMYRVSYAKALRKDRRPKEAEDVLSSILNLDPIVEGAVTQYAEAQADMGRYEEAIAYLEGVTQKNKTLIDVPVVLGKLYLEQNKLQEASAILQKVQKNAKTSQDRSNVLSVLGLLYAKQENYPQAIDALTESNKLRPDQAQTLFELGNVHYLKQNASEAEKYIVQALNIDHTLDQARERLVEIYFDGGKETEAQALVNEVLDVDPKNIDMLLAQGKILFKQKDYPKAYKTFDKVYLLDPENFDIQYYLGMTSRELGRLDDAFRFFKRALEIWPGSSKGHYQRGLTHLVNEDVRSASLDMDKALKNNPSWDKPNKAIARYYFDQGKYKQALEVYQEIVKRFPGDAQARLYLGKSYFSEQMPKQALKEFQKLVSDQPKNSQFHYELGVVHEDMGSFQKALGSLQRARNLNKSNADVVYHLGFVLKNLNRRKEAAKMFQTYLKMKPDSVEKQALEDEIFRLKNHS